MRPCFLSAVNIVLTTHSHRWDSSDPASLAEIHHRVAQRWYDLCTDNLGLYIKLGQRCVLSTAVAILILCVISLCSVAAMNHVLPPQYLEIFQNLHDKALTVNIDDINKIFLDEFGKLPGEVCACLTANTYH